ncbi:MAG TPA: precorrin-6A reductase [Polyangiaceae bacterium]|nr:precorrin-6A reductase [Polyangiaceae bacterium]
MSQRLVIVAGGTTESRVAVDALLAHGYRVLFSLATEAPFALPEHSNLSSRRGPLNANGWTNLIRESGAAALVDAAHPYATALREMLLLIAARLNLPLVRFKRGEIELDPAAVRVPNHDEAARLACSLGSRILITVGSRHLDPYVTAARKAESKLFVRVLDAPESREKIRELGCEPDQVIFGRGPYTLEQNVELLGKIRAEVMVTKDSGAEGGTAEKVTAAKLVGCKVVVVTRPEERNGAAQTGEELIDQLQRQIGSSE